jgi:hypothetical protein
MADRAVPFTSRARQLPGNDQVVEYAHDFFRPDYVVIELRST